MDIARHVLNLNINDILPNRFQPRIRFSEDALTELTNSIKEHGVIQPITVRPIGNKYEIIAGERRYKASVLAGKETIPAIVVNLDDNSCAELALIENVQRQDLTPIEEAISYKKILDMGSLTQEALAIKLGKNQSTIANKLRLLNLDDEVQKALLENRISERHARSLLKINDKQLQKQMLERIIEERLTVRRTDEEINKILNEDINNENKRMVGEENSMNGNTNDMNANNGIPNFNMNNMNNMNPYETNQVNNQNYQQAISNIPNQMVEQMPNNNLNYNQENFYGNSNQMFTSVSPMDMSNQNGAEASNNFGPSSSSVDVNKLIEQANQIAPEFNIPNTPIAEERISVNDLPTQNQPNMNFEPVVNNMSAIPSFNNMEIQPQAFNQSQMNIPTTPIEDNNQNNFNQMDNFSNIEEDNGLRPVKFFNMIDEQPSEPTVPTNNNMNDIFNAQPEKIPNNPIPNLNNQPEMPVNQNIISNNIQAQPEFIDNLEDQAVNMDFGSTIPNSSFDFSKIPNATIEQSQIPNESTIGQVNIPSAPTMSSTINMPNFLTEESYELKPKMPNQQPVRRVNISQAISEIRQCANKLENIGFSIDVEEYDLDQNYQIVIKIGKE